MTTSELIKLLQKEDPSGRLHVRVGNGTPIGVEQKPGYWDGAYSYIDTDGNYIISVKDTKIDIDTIDVEGFIWDTAGDISRIKFEGYDCYVDKEGTEKEIAARVAHFKSVAEDVKECLKRLDQSLLERAQVAFGEGFLLRQDKSNIWKSGFYKKGRKSKKCIFVNGYIGMLKKGYFRKRKETKQFIYWESKEK